MYEYSYVQSVGTRYTSHTGADAEKGIEAKKGALWRPKTVFMDIDSLIPYDITYEISHKIKQF